MKKLILFALAIWTIGSCREDSIVTNTIVEEPIPKETFLYEFGIFGLVVDEEGDPISLATVMADGRAVATDEQGYFEFEDLLAASDGLYVSAQKEGYVEGGVLIFPNEENTQQIKVVLIENNSSTLISNSQGGTLALQEGGEVIVPPNAFDAPDDIQVLVHFIPSSKENFSEVYPSAFVGIDKSESIKHLNSVGAVIVEFTDQSGNKVELKSGVNVTLRLPVPNGDWPNDILLWSLDEDSGLWIEESTATRVGDFYEGTVDHFSWWSASDPQDAVDVCFNVNTTGDELAAGIEYFILSWQTAGIYSGFTDAQGSFCVKVPDGDEIIVFLLDGCSNSIFDASYDINPSETEIDISINAIPDEVLLEGTITRCDGTDVQDGYLAMDFGHDQIIVPVENGAYSYTSFCGFGGETSIEVLAVDKSDLSSSSIEITYESGSRNYNTDITLCESLETFLRYNNVTQSEEIIFTECDARKNPVETLIVAEDANNAGRNVLLGVEGFDEGEFGTSLFGPQNDTALPDQFNTKITSYQGVGGYIEGTFNGVTDNGDLIEGDFRALRIK